MSASRRAYDLVVYGAEPCGLIAAACAARAGATCALIETGLEAPVATSAPAIPNFVWRRLDLHEAGLSVEPVSARVSLFKDGRALATYQDQLDTGKSLGEVNFADGAIWPDFLAEMRRKEEAAAEPGAALAEFAAGEADLSDASLLLSDMFSTDSLTAVLEDYFEDDDVKAHVAALSGAGFALGGEEPGSSLAAASVFADAAWRIRNAPALRAALEKLCADLNVDRFASPVRRIERQDARTLSIVLDDAEEIRTRAFMASSSRLAYAAGLKIEGATSPLVSSQSAEALVTIKLGERPARPAEEKAGGSAIYYLMETVEEMRAARDAVLEGRTPERPPLMFEIEDDRIHVRAPFCPRRLASEEGPRDWTGQDRQALGMQVLQRLGEVFADALKTVQETDVQVVGAGDIDTDVAINDDAPEVSAPPPAADEIGAAAKLALKLVANG